MQRRTFIGSVLGGIAGVFGLREKGPVIDVCEDVGHEQLKNALLDPDKFDMIHTLQGLNGDVLDAIYRQGPIDSPWPVTTGKGGQDSP